MLLLLYCNDFIDNPIMLCAAHALCTLKYGLFKRIANGDCFRSVLCVCGYATCNQVMNCLREKYKDDKEKGGGRLEKGYMHKWLNEGTCLFTCIHSDRGRSVAVT